MSTKTPISDGDMEHLQELARLRLRTEEIADIKADINKTLAYFEQLQELDTEGVEEMARPVEVFNIFRQDQIEASLPHEDAMAVAIEAQDGYYKVPRTVDGE